MAGHQRRYFSSLSSDLPLANASNPVRLYHLYTKIVVTDSGGTGKMPTHAPQHALQKAIALGALMMHFRFPQRHHQAPISGGAGQQTAILEAFVLLESQRNRIAEMHGNLVDDSGLQIDMNDT